MNTVDETPDSAPSGLFLAIFLCEVVHQDQTEADEQRDQPSGKASL